MIAAMVMKAKMRPELIPAPVRTFLNGRQIISPKQAISFGQILVGIQVAMVRTMIAIAQKRLVHFLRGWNGFRLSDRIVISKPYTRCT